MENVVHIHNVIFLIQKLGEKQVKANDLTAIIKSEWGENVQHVACSGIPFPPQEALSFLLERNKIVLDSEGFVDLHPEIKLCNSHEE